MHGWLGTGIIFPKFPFYLLTIFLKIGNLFQFVGICLAFRFRHIPNPKLRRNPSEFLWLPYLHNSLQIESTCIWQKNRYFLCENIDFFNFLLLEKYGGRRQLLTWEFLHLYLVKGSLNSRFWPNFDIFVSFQIIGAVLAYRYRNLMDPNAAMSNFGHNDYNAHI